MDNGTVSGGDELTAIRDDSVMRSDVTGQPQPVLNRLTSGSGRWAGCELRTNVSV